MIFEQKAANKISYFFNKVVNCGKFCQKVVNMMYI